MLAIRLAIATAALSGAFWTPAAEAYKISVLGKFHERFTRLAERCLPAGGGPPSKCRIPKDARAFKAVSWKDGSYWQASRWPDDPTRQSSSTGVLKFLANVGIDHCVNYIGATGNDFAGLLCNSHYGTLQFLHGMASIASGETVDGAKPEAFETTRDKILGWTALAFRVATGALPLNAPFCDTARGFGPVGAALAPAAFPFCASWTIDSIFHFRCDNPVSSATCSTDVPEADIRRAAVGSLLHMIQDSYSRSHTGRGENLPNGPYKSAAVRCEPISAFYRYSMAQKKEHPKADKAPGFDPECADASRMDPITASARIIWLAENDCDASWAVHLIDNGVIANRPTAGPSSVAECRVARSNSDVPGRSSG